MNSQEPILINNPFPPSLAENPRFVIFSWFMDKDGKETSLLDYINRDWDSFHTRVETYNFWGLQVRLPCLLCFILLEPKAFFLVAVNFN